MKKILVMGLPGVGKTTFAKQLAPKLQAVHLNADEIRKEINKDLGFSEADRIEQARRMGVLSDIVCRSGNFAIADFICPTPETRKAFGSHYFLIWVDRVPCRGFPDTTKMFVPPSQFDLQITNHHGPEFWAEIAVNLLFKNTSKNYYEI
jgi:adenylylsulfate kinase